MRGSDSLHCIMLQSYGGEYNIGETHNITSTLRSRANLTQSGVQVPFCNQKKVSARKAVHYI